VGGSFGAGGAHHFVLLLNLVASGRKKEALLQSELFVPLVVHVTVGCLYKSVRW
jgi:hypothetical protein